MMLGLGLALPLIPIQGGTVGLSPGGDLFPDAYFAADFVGTNTVRLNGATTSLANTAGISITRATTGYALTQQGQLVSFPSGAARIGNRGLLVEGAATNLLLQSQTFSTTWSTTNLRAFGSGSTVDAADAPDGTTTADFICEDTTNGAHAIVQSVSGNSTLAYTFSVHVKAAGRTRVFLSMRNNAQSIAIQSVFNLSGAGAVDASSNSGSPSSANTPRITALANGWYRCEVGGILNAAGGAENIRCQIYIDNGSSGAASTSYTGDDASGLYVWGAQLEQSAYSTSYVPTTAGSATRNADVISVGSVTGLTFPLTLFAEFERASDTSAVQALLRVDDTTGNNRALIYVDASDLAAALSTAGGVAQSGLTVAGATATGTVLRVAARYNTNSVQLARGGTLATEDVSATNPAAPTRIEIGCNASAAQTSGYLRRLAIFGSAYSDAQLQSLTS